MTSKKVHVLSVWVLTTVLMLASLAPRPAHGLYLFQDFLKNQSQILELASSLASTSLGRSAGVGGGGGEASTLKQVILQQATVPQEQAQQQGASVKTSAAAPSMDSFTVGGLRPSNIASLLNTVSETGFSYFNVHDQCRSRTACDVGFMLYKKLNFIHNWIIRASVRTLVDANNIYAQSWTTGMLGRNCTLTYPSCNQSPLDSLMSFAILSG